ncbi:cytochrome ubiquinol oxidase subunit I [Aeromicrobium massiliense]|uniref:cytochrome ubiquinol oxidase subunit I n=1 Tax=Aeromicrobium massiliense TaxID=1464554 RepID=UPI00031B5370|nr:cytochrome ubiquinol oxidase subunit I [Aeromicrobium massiliense]
MEALEIARWQFGITTVYHFFFVPITIGLSFLVAGLQTAWFRTQDEKYLRLTKFFGKLFLINFAMGIVTGIVQEFQFGMNWSDYSRFVGDIFGAPLAIEGLLAFFLESTFLGLWIFGWEKLRPGVHLATIWIAAIGTVLSAYFILAANSFMQNPVGFTFNETLNRAELTDFWAVMTNPVVLVTFPHQITACFLVGGGFVAGVALWRLVRRSDDGHADTWRTAMRLGAVTLVISGLGVAITGDMQSKVMMDVQPMKMAAAEGLYEDEQPASFSILTVGTPDGKHELWSIKVPHLLSYLANGDFDSEVRGINSLQAEYEAKYGEGVKYSPNIPVTYWAFRWMIALGMAAAAAGAWLLWVTRKGRTLTHRRWAWLGVALPFLPLFGNSFGWIFTEMGRQPWLVFGMLPTAAGVSPGVSAGTVLTSLIGFTALYGVLAVIEVKLLLAYINKGLPDEAAPRHPDDVDDDTPLAFAY